MPILKGGIRMRLSRLDPDCRFRLTHKEELASYLGTKETNAVINKPLTITFAV